MSLRAYDSAADREGLWELKAAFERELGDGGGETKATRYEDKLTDDYRERYLAWVERCVTHDPGSVTVAVDDGLVGYVFLLPDDLALIWDAAVVNEIYVHPSRRGSGLADDLMDAALAHAREQELPLDRVVLDVDRENERAREFYDRHGFDHWGEMVARDL